MPKKPQPEIEPSAYSRRRPEPMKKIERDLDRIRVLLRHHIRWRGFTQLEVQEALGWGRSYVSQLLTGQKSMRVEQVIMILNVIGATPEEFFDDVFHFGTAHATRPAETEALAGMRTWFECLARLLIDKSLITVPELEQAVANFRRTSGDGR